MRNRAVATITPARPNADDPASTTCPSRDCRARRRRPDGLVGAALGVLAGSVMGAAIASELARRTGAGTERRR